MSDKPFSCPARFLTSSPVNGSQIFTRLSFAAHVGQPCTHIKRIGSAPHDASICPSGLNFTDESEAVWPRIVCLSAYLGLSRGGPEDAAGAGTGAAGAGAGVGAGVRATPTLPGTSGSSSVAWDAASSSSDDESSRPAKGSRGMVFVQAGNSARTGTDWRLPLTSANITFVLFYLMGIRQVLFLLIPASQLAPDISSIHQSREEGS
jgi:hypothetical protein